MVRSSTSLNSGKTEIGISGYSSAGAIHYIVSKARERPEVKIKDQRSPFSFHFSDRSQTRAPPVSLLSHQGSPSRSFGDAAGNPATRLLKGSKSQLTNPEYKGSGADISSVSGKRELLSEKRSKEDRPSGKQSSSGMSLRDNRATVTSDENPAVRKSLEVKHPARVRCPIMTKQRSRSH